MTSDLQASKDAKNCLRLLKKSGISVLIIIGLIKYINLLNLKINILKNHLIAETFGATKT